MQYAVELEAAIKMNCERVILWGKLEIPVKSTSVQKGRMCFFFIGVYAIIRFSEKISRQYVDKLLIR